MKVVLSNFKVAKGNSQTIGRNFSEIDSFQKSINNRSLDTTELKAKIRNLGVGSYKLDERTFESFLDPKKEELLTNYHGEKVFLTYVEPTTQNQIVFEGHCQLEK
jgi:hypothetical protein